jgi:hypothetical protein
MRRLAEHADIGAGAKDIVLARLDDDAADLRMLEAQPLDGIVQFNVDAEVVGIELEFVVAEPAGLVDVHDQIGDVTVELDAPVPVARGVGLVVDCVCHGLEYRVIPERERSERTRNPETDAMPRSGFRVRPFGPSRNDGVGRWPALSCIRITPCRQAFNRSAIGRFLRPQSPGQ